MCLKNNTRQQNEINNFKATVDRMENKTNDIQRELEQLKHLKSVDQLQTLTNIANKVNTFDSSINLLSGHEQSRNQDFLGLYSLTTATTSRLNQLETQYNTSKLFLQEQEKQARNFTTRLDMLTNDTDSKIDSLNQHQSLSITQLQQTIEQNNNKVVLVACNQINVAYNSGESYKFANMVTKVGLPHLTTFPSTGKFVCPVKGIYYISAVLTTYQNLVEIEIMKNSVKMYRQYITNGNTGGAWDPGAAIIAIELEVNDTVWIKTNTDSFLYYSCLTIFKL